MALLWGARIESPRDLPPPYATPSADNRPKIVPKPQRARLKVPAGFEVNVWAEGFRMPRFLLQGDHGEILLSDSGEDAEAAAVGHVGGGRHDGTVYVFPNGDVSRRKTLLTGLNRPYGLALWKQYLYVGEADSIRRYPYDPAHMTAGIRRGSHLSEGVQQRALDAQPLI